MAELPHDIQLQWFVIKISIIFNYNNLADCFSYGWCHYK